MMRRYLLIIAMFAISINVFADMPILETLQGSCDGFDRIMFLGWSDTVGPAYVDDILVYEGNVRPAGLVAPVEPWDKAAVVWGAIKSD